MDESGGEGGGGGGRQTPLAKARYSDLKDQAAPSGGGSLWAMAQVRKAASRKRPAAAAALDNARGAGGAGDAKVENNAREMRHKDVPEGALKLELSCANVAGLLANVSFPVQARRDNCKYVPNQERASENLGRRCVALLFG